MIQKGQKRVSILKAAEALARGEIVGMPTETVYGLAADADNQAAVAEIFRIKRRPADHPLIVHVLGVDLVPEFARDVPRYARRLLDVFWPGPLTVILPRRFGRGDAAAGGQDSIGLRSPSHPVSRALMTACGELGVVGLAAPSANQFGRVSPTTAQHVVDEFGDDLLVLNGGACPVGIESSIIDCTREAPVLLRPGGLSREQLAAVAGRPILLPADAKGCAPRASGTLASHYAPSARVHLMDGAALQDALSSLSTRAGHIGVWSRALRVPTSSFLLFRPMPVDPQTAARELFAALRDFDAHRVNEIWVETPPPDSGWDGVRDRLKRAAA